MVLDTKACSNIYYLRRSDAHHVSLYSYHPTNYNCSGAITSFEYSAADYQVVPIWDCKIALIPENSTSEPIAVFDLTSLKFELMDFSLLEKRSKFAAQLVNGHKLYVCGGLNKTEGACEVWEDKKNEFVDSGHSWPSAGLVLAQFTLHQVRDKLCTFGGRKLFYLEPESTRVVFCFDIATSNLTKLEDIDGLDCSTKHLAKDCNQHRYGHTSILIGEETVVVCGAQIMNKSCDVLEISGQKKKLTKRVNFPGYTPLYSKLLKWGTDILAFGVSDDVKPSTRSVTLAFSRLFGKRLPLQHNVSEIQLFSAPMSCRSASTTTKDQSSSSTISSFGSRVKQSTKVSKVRPPCIVTNLTITDGKNKCFDSTIMIPLILCFSLVIFMLVVLVCYFHRRHRHCSKSDKARTLMVPEPVSNTLSSSASVPCRTLVQLRSSALINDYNLPLVQRDSTLISINTKSSQGSNTPSPDPGTSTSAVLSIGKMLQMSRTLKPDDVVKHNKQTSKLESISTETLPSGSIHCMNNRANNQFSEPVTIGELPIQIMRRIWRRQIKERGEHKSKL